jgi:hypothetical protein
MTICRRSRRALGFVIVILATIIYTAATEPGLKPVAWVLFGLMFLTLAAVVGGLCGLAGGVLAQSSVVRSLWGRRP